MNKGAVRSYAVFARRKLREKIGERINTLGISICTSSEGKEIVFSGDYEIQNKEVQELISIIQEKGYVNLLEEAAYEWFMQIILWRFFEANRYIPENMRILYLSNENKCYSDILYAKIYGNSFQNKTQVNIDETYRELIIEQMNNLSNLFPKNFKRIEKHKILLLPNGLLEEDSFIQRLISTIDEEDFKEVEIIGWFYQFYMSETHHYVVGMNNGVIQKEHIPVATQLFTPKWIVRYMVDNSLGKLLVEENKLIDLKVHLQLYIEDSFSMINNQYEKLENIKILDPACGTGNILIYCFELLFKAYLSKGYKSEEIPYIILEHNIYGFDIDSKTVEIAIFSLLVKCREAYPEFFNSVDYKKLKMNLICIEESNPVIEILDSELSELSLSEDEKEKVHRICNCFIDAKEYGALVEVETYTEDFYSSVLNKIINSSIQSKDLLVNILIQSKAMGIRYDVVIANPPYMSKKYMNINLKKFINEYYYDYNGDLFSVFILRNLKYAKEKAYAAFMTPFVWMFIKEYERLREYIIDYKTIDSLIQLEYSAYKDAAVPICTFVLRNYKEIKSGTYIKLSDFRGRESQESKTIEAVKNEYISYRYKCNSEFFKFIPGKPIAYWLPQGFLNVFTSGKSLQEYIDITGSQNITADNEKYLRKHWEVNIKDIGSKWCFYTKGGDYRKWYGNVEYVVDWSKEAREFYRKNKTSNLLSKDYWFRDGLTYNGISIKGFAVRKVGRNIYDKGGPTFHVLDKELEKYILALLNSKVIEYIMNLYNPTINYQVQDIKNLPIIVAEDELIFKRVVELCDECLNISKRDWDSLEISAEFRQHPIIEYTREASLIQDAYNKFMDENIKNIKRLKDNEEELNRIFIKLYKLEGVISPVVDEKSITIQTPNIHKDMRSFISYAVGCIMGRYTLSDEEGSILNNKKYNNLQVYSNGICPLYKYDLGKEDLVNAVVSFIEAMFGKEYISENLNFISKALNEDSTKTPREIIREYFVYDFFMDHYRTFKKRPIYFMPCSGKRRTVNGLMYIHKFSGDAIESFKKESVQAVYKLLKERCMYLQNTRCKNIEKSEAIEELRKRELYRIKEDLNELDKYIRSIEELCKTDISINIDDGVKNNYLKLSRLLLSCK